MQHSTIIEGRPATDDGWTWSTNHPRDRAWWEIELPPCPDCGGILIWWEAGYIPGTRRCLDCASLFEVTSDGERFIVRRARFY